MKAIVYHRYGPPDVLQIEEIEKPAPGDKEVLIKIHAASVNPLDWHFMRGTPYVVRAVKTGLWKPKVARLGVDVAGRVEAVGSGVSLFKPGDEVFGVCHGAFAEYVCTSESLLEIKPDRATFDQAAAVPVAAITALQSLRDKGDIQPGKTVLVNGASGGVGTFGVQIAKAFGAEVTAVCSTRNMEMVRSLGADRIIDYTSEDFTTSGKHYDLILDCVGNHSLSTCRRILKPDGICVMAGGPSGRWKMGLTGAIRAKILSQFGSRKLVGILARIKRADFTTLRDLISAGKVTPAIDRSYSLSHVPDAIRYLEEGHARGKIVIAVGS